MSRIYPIRIFLSLLLLIGLSWVWVDRLDELAYFLTPQPLQSMGFVSNANDLRQIPDNSFVEVQGVLGDDVEILKGVRTGSFRFGPIEVRRLLGSPIFVEYDQAKFQTEFIPSQRISVTGRLVSFDETSELKKESAILREKLKSDFPEHARIIVVDERPFGDWRYPLLFLLSLIAVAASFWSALRTASEGNRYS